MGKITNLQRKFIDSFHCERLSCDELNKELIHKFVNIQGQSLVDYLRSKAWGEDINCANAFYLIKDTEGEVVLFFSLKSGIVFNPFDEEEYKNKIDSFKNVMRVFNMLKKDNTEEKRIS